MTQPALDVPTLQAVRDELHAGTSRDPSKRIPAMFQWLEARGAKPPHQLASERAVAEMEAAAVERAAQDSGENPEL